MDRHRTTYCLVSAIEDGVCVCYCVLAAVVICCWFWWFFFVIIYGCCRHRPNDTTIQCLHRLYTHTHTIKWPNYNYFNSFFFVFSLNVFWCRKWRRKKTYETTSRINVAVFVFSFVCRVYLLQLHFNGSYSRPPRPVQFQFTFEGLCTCARAPMCVCVIV